MMHKHKVYDTDPCFSINPYTRIIKNETSTKITLIQHDHNSERFTFEIPRFIEEHDMSLCNVVQVHYINIESGNKNQNEDVYDVIDLHIDPDDSDKVICSWLVSGNATKYVGSLNFVVRFSCVTDGVIDYAWNTAVFSGISVSTGIFNTDVVAEEYSDIIASWAARIEALEQGGAGGKVKKVFIPYDNSFTYGCYTFIEGENAPLYVTNDFLEEHGINEICPVDLTVLWNGQEKSMTQLTREMIAGKADPAFVTLMNPKDIESTGTDKLIGVIYNTDGNSDSTLLSELSFNSNGLLSGIYLYYFDQIEVVE